MLKGVRHGGLPLNALDEHSAYSQLISLIKLRTELRALTSLPIERLRHITPRVAQIMQSVSLVPHPWCFAR
jgi:hypothetical protein